MRVIAILLENFVDEVASRYPSAGYPKEVLAFQVLYANTKLDDSTLPWGQGAQQFELPKLRQFSKILR